jgi:hypothetical protein
VPPDDPSGPEPDADAPPFEAAEDDDRTRTRYRRTKSSSGRIWVAAGIAAVVLASVGAGVFLFASRSAPQDEERRQMDSLYSDMKDYSDSAVNRPLNRADPDEDTVRFNITNRVLDAMGKLRADYRARYGADPAYVKPGDRVRPNPMELRYPTDVPR